MRTDTIGAKYLTIGVVLAAFAAVLVAVVQATPAPVAQGAFNYVPLRFAAFVAGVATLAVMWTRFAAQNLS